MGDSNKLRINKLAVRWGSIHYEHHKNLAELSPQINIIMGPNASGKTTLARALRHVIWNGDAPGYLHHAVIEAEATLESKQVRFKWNNGHDTLLIDNQPVDRNILTGGTQADRYHLSLHHLLVEDDQDLARQLNHEMMGGYDLQRAKNELHYTDSVPTTAIGKHKELRQRLKEARSLERTFSEIKDLEHRVDELNKQLDKLQKAKARKAFLAEIREYLGTIQKHKEAVEQLATFDDRINYSKLTGKEWKDLRDLETEREKLNQQLEEQKRKKDRINDELEALNLPDKKPALSQVSEWLDQANNLERLLEEFDRLENQIEECERKIREQQKTISEQDFDIKWHQPDRTDWDALERTMIELLETKGLIEATDNLIGTLRKRVENFSDLPNDAQLSEVLTALKNLAPVAEEDTTTIPVPVSALIVIVTGIILTSLVAFLQVELSVVLAILTAIVILYLYFNRKSEAKEKQQFEWQLKVQQANFVKLPSFSASAIKRAIDDTIHLKIQWAEKKYLQHQIMDLQQSLKHQVKKRQIQKTRLKKFKETFGALPEFESAASFYHFIRHWFRLHELKGSLESLKHKRTEVSNIITGVRKQIQTIKAQLPRENLDTDTPAIKKSISGLQDRLQQHDKLENSFKTLTADIAHTRRDLDKVINNINTIKRLFPPEADMADIKNWCDEVETWHSTQKEVDDLQVKLNTQAEMLKNRAVYQKGDLNRTEDDIKEETARLERETGKEEAVKQELKEIQKKINQAMDGRKMEELQQQIQEAWWNLKERRDENINAAAGHILYELLLQHTQHDSMPQVLKSASTWLSTFTQGQYSLQVLTPSDANHQARFKAVETDSNHVFDLDELSSGTRVQLLLAVRLAYVEHQESETRLPLIIDELLANSDDQRATQIIEALLSIAESGRQIFYFTAQSDEVLKWQAVCRKAVTDVLVKDYTLSAQSTDHPHPEQVETLPDLITTVPRPQGDEHSDYAKKLNVSPFNPVAQPPEALHLWYIIEDVNKLHELLSRNIQKWAQLKTLIAIDDQSLLPSKGAEHLKQNMEIISHYLQLVKKGRSKPINEHVLKQSGAVSERFWDEVVEKMHELHNDPDKLLEALDVEVANFRHTKIEELQDYLIQNHFLSQEKPLKEFELQHHIQQFAEQYPRADIDWVQRVIDRINTYSSTR